MNGHEGNKQHERTILAAFQTGQSVFVDYDRQSCYMDGSYELVAGDRGLRKEDFSPEAIIGHKSSLPWRTRLRGGLLSTVLSCSRGIGFWLHKEVVVNKLQILARQV